MYIIMSGAAGCDSPKRMIVSVIKSTCNAEEVNLGHLSMYLPCQWPESSNNMSPSPTPSIGSAGSLSPGQSPDLPAYKDGMRRGRPRAEIVRDLITEGNLSTSRIRCHVCNRVFPREKSLQAHKRTHTGERPYVCDYPSCGKAFVQSGQLKTHQRLHTGEKPFICSEPGCATKFAHANRHCAKHPYARLRRQEGASDQDRVTASEEDKAVAAWLARYWQSREQRQAPMKEGTGFQKSDQEQKNSTYSHPEEEELAPYSGHQLQEQKERWHGALALIQLASLCSAQPL
ncbi:zinc finger protein 367-like [Hypanus sabinus]|uniref:zinc finger protein 367-like n=1 Tax=Hypanus sabinus TaxID=79690 RepID=UPI0028C4EFF6|nr:zinc finger protein 367-like [Hypanus sabinus]